MVPALAETGDRWLRMGSRRYSNGDHMADQTQTPLREDTYSSFIGMVKVGSIVVAIAAAVVVGLIAS
jgi:hypothetical protein